MSDFLRHAWTIAAKDLRTEMRNREVINAAASFALVVLLMFGFAFDPSSNFEVRSLTGGLLWIIYVFSGILVLNRSFAQETVNDCLGALTAAPISPASIFIGKAFANWVLLLAMELISLPLFGMFFDIRWYDRFGDLLLILALGSWALSIIGTIFGAVTANNRLRELMLPVLVFPMILPALMACVQLTGLALLNEPFGDSIAWLKLLIGFDIIFTLLGSVLLEPVLHQ